MNTQKAIYLLAGSPGSRRRSPDPLIQAIFQEAGQEQPSVAYVGAASDDDKSFFRFIADYFVRAGAGAVTHAVMTPAKADLKKASEILQSADIIFISGGDVEAGMQVLQEKKMIALLTRLYLEGKPFFGISAGSIMLAKEWVRWRDADDDSTAELFPCLGFAPVICDTHAEEDDWEELQAALALEKDGIVGYGITSGSAIRVSPDGEIVALGGSVAQYLNQHGKIVKKAALKPVNSLSSGL